MRIIAGELGGRQIESPHGHRTHPMSEKIRGALFNSLGDVHGLEFLDAFAGTGALAFEAISRGAKSALAVEYDVPAFKTLQTNRKALDMEDKVEIIRKDVKSWSRNNKDRLFDVVLCDPPYDAVKYRLLLQLAEHAKPDGLVIYSLPPDHTFNLPTESYKHISSKSYGDAVLEFYVKKVS